MNGTSEILDSYDKYQTVVSKYNIDNFYDQKYFVNSVLVSVYVTKTNNTNLAEITKYENVIYISEDSSSSSTLKVDANSDFVSSYTMKPISCGNYYFLVLKAAKVTGPNQEEKASEIEAGLIEELFAENDNNIDRMIYERRHDAGLEISIY